MKLSESIRIGVMEAAVGAIINKFKIKTRRTTLFFEDVIAQYIKECENAGYGQNVMEIGEKWGALGTKKLGKLKMLKSISLLNKIMKVVWHNIGLMEDFSVKKIDNKVIVETNNEFITRIIGKNHFMTGFFAGCSFSFVGKRVKIEKLETKGNKTKYTFITTKNSINIESKDKDIYNKLNSVPKKNGFVLKNALGSRILNLKGNRIYFRGKSIIPIENTVFHLLGSENIIIENVIDISYNFFKDIVDSSSPVDKKLMLLKTLLQTLGWCVVAIENNKNEIIINAKNLPVGLQKSDDSWIFLINVISGYLKMVNNNFSIKQIVNGDRRLRLVYSKKKS